MTRVTTDAGFQFLGESEFESASTRLSGFEVHGFSARSPVKHSDNEDSALAVPYGEDGLVLAVADGAGGLPAGRKASNTIVETLAELLPLAASESVPMRIAIMSAIEECNRRILGFSNGSASTLTVAGIESDAVRHYQVGDSVALLFGQRGKLRSQTMQHSPVGFAIEAGLLDEREAMLHEDRHFVSNFVGIPAMRIEVSSLITMSVRDTVIVASDGLADNLHLDEIISMASHGKLAGCIDELGESALARMSYPEPGEPSKADDITVLIARRVCQPRRRPRPAVTSS